MVPNLCFIIKPLYKGAFDDVNYYDYIIIKIELLFPLYGTKQVFYNGVII